MKKLLYLSLLVVSGCTTQRSETKSVTATTTNYTYAVTTSFFDSTSSLAKFHNSASGTNGGGTSVGSVNDSASSTNLNALLSAVVSAAIQGAK